MRARRGGQRDLLVPGLSQSLLDRTELADLVLGPCRSSPSDREHALPENVPGLAVRAVELGLVARDALLELLTAYLYLRGVKLLSRLLTALNLLPSTATTASANSFGRGDYRYFDYPLPPLIGALRESLYAYLAPVANRWYDAMGMTARFPDRHTDFIDRCHAAGQEKPTPLLLQYGRGDYNFLHQDVYGEHVFPLQLVLLLSEPGRDFEGGEFVMTEQRRRMQSRGPLVLPLRQGDAAVVADRHRPVRGARGVYRVNLKHGVSHLRSGHRHTAGIIFHDAA